MKKEKVTLARSVNKKIKPNKENKTMENFTISFFMEIISFGHYEHEDVERQTTSPEKP